MIIYIHGKDTFRSKQYLKQTIEQFKEKRDPQGYNVIILDGKNDEVGKILSEIKSSPFLAEKRMVVINDVLSGKDKDLLWQLIEMIKKDGIPDSNIVVFWQGEALGKVKEIKELEKLLKKEKYAQEFILLKGAQLSSWIKQEITKRSGQINQEALDYLVQNVGDDIWFLNSVIDQLIAYVESEIQLQHIQLFLDEKIDDNIFNMVEAIVSGNRKQAFKLLNEQRRLGEDEPKIFGLITWQFRILLEMRDLFDREDDLTSDQMAKRLGIHPFVARKNLYLVKRFSLNKLKQLHKYLLDIDHKTKTGQGDQSLLVDLFVGKV